MAKPGKDALARCCLLAFVALAALAMIWPGPALIADRVRPFVLGLPFAFAWNVFWLLAVFVALALYHLGAGERD